MFKQLALRYKIDEQIIRNIISDLLMSKKYAEIKAIYETKSIDELELILNTPVDSILGITEIKETIIERKPKKKAINSSTIA